VRWQSSRFSLAVTGAGDAGIARPGSAGPAPTVGGMRSWSPQRRRCRTTRIAAGSGLVSCFENPGLLGWTGRAVRARAWVGPEPGLCRVPRFRLEARSRFWWDHQIYLANSWAAREPLDGRSTVQIKRGGLNFAISSSTISPFF
jgi:hypothetical protein